MPITTADLDFGYGNSNFVIDNAEQYIQLPSRDDVVLKDPKEFIKRLDEIISPRDRLVEFLASLLNPWADTTHEAVWCRTTTFSAAVFGTFFGALFNSKDVHQDYARQHNAAIFDNKFFKDRHFTDSLIRKLLIRGGPYGVKSVLLVGTASVISMGSITYRNRLYLPDWLVGIGAIGAVSRLWHGSRAIVAGGAMGAAAGLFGYGLLRGFEISTRQSITQTRYIEHQMWLKKQEAKEYSRKLKYIGTQMETSKSMD